MHMAKILKCAVTSNVIWVGLVSNANEKLVFSLTRGIQFQVQPRPK